MTETVLAFDTSGAHCAAAIWRNRDIVTAQAEDMARGQAERLVPLLQDVLSSAGLTWADLTRIGVGIGPGNFTGIRISVACARGLALALNIPAIGVSGFEAIGAIAPGTAPLVPAPREQLYTLGPDGQPMVIPAAEAPADAQMLPPPKSLAKAIALVSATARPGPPPSPLYVRPADAAPSRDLPPLILDDA